MDNYHHIQIQIVEQFHQESNFISKTGECKLIEIK